MQTPEPGREGSGGPGLGKLPKEKKKKGNSKTTIPNSPPEKMKRAKSNQKPHPVKGGGKGLRKTKN